MQYKIIRQFRDVCGAMRLPGDVAEFDNSRAALLRFNGLIAPAEMPKSETAEIKRVESADAKPSENANASRKQNRVRK